MSGTFSRLKEQEKDLRRNIIIDAAEKEFAVKPFNKVNMRDIAKNAGISPASIYRYFPDQQSLFLEAFVRGTKDIFQKLADMAEESSDGSLDEVTFTFIDYFTQHDQYFSMLMHFFLDGTVEQDVFEKLSSLERDLLSVFDTIFSKMKMKKDVRFNSHAFFAALVGIVATFRNRPDKNEPEILHHRKRIAGIIAGHFRNSIS